MGSSLDPLAPPVSLAPEARLPLAPEARLPLALLLLGVASATFDVGCVLIKAPFLRPGITAGDALEAVGVLVVAALFAWAVRLAGGVASRLAGGMPSRSAWGMASRSAWPATVAVLAVTTFAFGHGIHIASNSIHDLAERAGAGDPLGLLEFWDEGAGHYVVETGRALFAMTLIWVAGQGGSDVGSREVGAGRGGNGLLSTIAGGVFYGFTTFASAVEGQTVPLVLSLYLVIVAWGVSSWRRRRDAGRPETSVRHRPERSVRRFYLASAGTALILFAIWGVWHRGFPEFTRAGIISGAGGTRP